MKLPLHGSGWSGPSPASAIITLPPLSLFILPDLPSVSLLEERFIYVEVIHISLKALPLPAWLLIFSGLAYICHLLKETFSALTSMTQLVGALPHN